MVRFYFESINRFPLKKLEIKNWLKKVIINENYEPSNINLIFCSDKYLIEINKKYLAHDYFTDIITFNYCEEKLIAGDIYISVDRIKENASLFKTNFENELNRVMVHGILHLLKYDDKTEEQKKEMTAKENQYLKIR
ncbi:MAG: rRNA maturation RNase YbeY [Bacteroidetes bacterium]|nr:MAG: rRNA maturation RNase YbeY [Bacteroidota bacterium]